MMPLIPSQPLILSAPATRAPATVKHSPLYASPSLHLSLYHSWESEHVIHPPKDI